MIIGDPYKFSIFMKCIKEWNLDETFCNGVLIFCVDGIFFPKEVVTATLKGEISYLREKLKNLSVDDELYVMPKDEAFTAIYNMTYPKNCDSDNDYRFDITPLSLRDAGCFVFAVCNGTQIRILAATLDYIIEESQRNLKNLDVREAFITNNELKYILSQLVIT